MPGRIAAAAALAVLLLAPLQALAGLALLFEPVSGKVLYAEDPDLSWHPASLTKLMTVYVAFGAISRGELTMEDKVICSANANKQPPSKIGLPVGAEMGVGLALRVLLVKSANDVAVMLAEKVGGSEAKFIDQMNAAAERLGMTRTHYVNPHGLPDDRQVTTARDLAILTRAIMKEYPDYADLFALPYVKVGKRRMNNHNSLLRSYIGADGMKTGFICASGYNVVASATRDRVRLVAVVLGARTGQSRLVRASELLDHGFEWYRWKALFARKLDRLPVQQAALAEPATDLHANVCGGRRPASSHRGKR